MRPLRDNVIIAQSGATKMSAGGIVLTQDLKPKSKNGVVLEVGPDAKFVQQGDTVFVDWSKASIISVGDMQAVVVEEKHILAVLER